MSVDSEPSREHISSGSGQAGGTITLQKAVDMGEYDPVRLQEFAEWHTLSRYMQFALIRQGIDNRFNSLLSQWATIANVPDFSRKPQLAGALRNIERQQEFLQRDKERLYLEYSRI